MSTEASLELSILLTEVIDAFQDLHDIPAPPPPASAPGPALLDDHETGMLDDFFEQMNTGQLDDSNFTLSGLSQHKHNSTWDVWPDELPPMFHGSTSLLAPPNTQPTASLQRSIHHDFDFGQEQRFIGEQRQAVTTSPEILAAASTLVHNGHNDHIGFPNGTSHRLGQQLTSHTNQQPFLYPENEAYDSTQAELYHQNFSGTGPENERPLSPALLHGDSVLQNMFFGPIGPNDVRRTNSNKAARLRWGSDANFYDHCFVAPPNQETVEEVTKTQLGMMECLEPQISAANTQPSSPMMSRPRKTADGQNGKSDPRVSNSSKADNGNKHSAQTSAADSKPRKRRKGRLKAEPDDEAEEEESKYLDHKRVSLRRNGRRQSSIRDSKPKRQSPNFQDRGKRGRSLSGEQKSGRDNLTDEQKRSNHILSEQKRRNLIKQGFADLCELVPELQGGGFSKSAMLTQAAEWLEDLIQDNESIRQRLAAMKQRVRE